MKNNMNTEWITDRLPTAEDALTDGSVWTFYDGKVMIWSYDGVQLGTPWQPIHLPEPYVNPKTWTLRWNILGGCWLLENKRNDWVVLSYITEDQDEVAQQIEDIYNEVKPLQQGDAMKPLQRYEIDESGWDIPVSDGDWVKWEDVKKLEEQNEKMLRVLKIYAEGSHEIGTYYAENVLAEIEGENQ
jgi:hypothetical protein